MRVRVETAAARAPLAIVLERLQAKLVVLACGVSRRALLEVRVATAAARAAGHRAGAAEGQAGRAGGGAAAGRGGRAARRRRQGGVGPAGAPRLPRAATRSSNRKAHVQMLAACMCGRTSGAAKGGCVPHVLGPRRARACRRAHTAHRLLRCSMASAAAAHAQGWIYVYVCGR